MPKTQIRHVLERTGVLNNHETYFYFFCRTDRQAFLLKYLLKNIGFSRVGLNLAHPGLLYNPKRLALTGLKADVNNQINLRFSHGGGLRHLKTVTKINIIKGHFCTLVKGQIKTFNFTA